MSSSVRVAVLGNGGWGTAMAMTLSHVGHDVCVWGHFEEEIAAIRVSRRNDLYLAGIDLPPEIEWTSDRCKAVEGADVVVLAMPSKFFGPVLREFDGMIPDATRVVSLAKGFDPTTRKRMSEIAREILHGHSIAVLSGPSHAEEVARRIPTAVVLACADHDVARDLQALFIGDRFRVYSSDDVIGVELGGALKNIVAVAVGVSDGLGFGDNTRAALIARGLAEMTRLGVALGASRETFAGLSGLGDLVVTCSSQHSRNRGVGERIGRGEPIKSILGGMKQVAEGIDNCAIACALAATCGVEVPIAREVNAIVHEGRSPGEAVAELLTRDAKPESA